HLDRRAVLSRVNSKAGSKLATRSLACKPVRSRLKSRSPLLWGKSHCSARRFPATSSLHWHLRGNKTTSGHESLDRVFRARLSRYHSSCRHRLRSLVGGKHYRFAHRRHHPGARSAYRTGAHHARRLLGFECDRPACVRSVQSSHGARSTCETALHLFA